jgi:glycosyltransferase involved in cell wall biosynthesis
MQVLPFHQFGRPGDVHRGIYFPFSQKLARFNPHLIYCEHEQEGLITVETALLRRLFLPHSFLILYSWQNILRPRNLLVRFIDRITLNAAQHIFCASGEGIVVLRRKGYTSDATVIQQMGLDQRYFYRKSDNGLRARLGLNGFVVGYVGRLVPEKGVELILRAVATLPSNLPVNVLIVGEGTTKTRLQRLAQTLGIFDRCHFLEKVPYEQVMDYLNVMNLLVLPSLTTQNWKEQFGRVLVEAMACQVNVAGSDSGAIPEVIGDAGVIFPEGSIEPMAEIIREFATNQEMSCVLAERGYRRVLEKYTVEKLAEQTLAVWKNLRMSEGIRGFR